MDWLLFLNIFRLLLTILVLGCASVLDIRTRKVPNYFWIALGLIGLALIECQIILEFGHGSFILLINIIPITVLFMSFLACDWVVDLEKMKLNEPWLFLFALTGFALFYFFLFGPNDVLGNNFGTITLTPIILILIYFTLIMLLINYLEFRAYQDFKRVLKLQTAKKTRHKTTPTKNINKHTETDDNDELSVDERFSWVLFIGLLTFLIIVFLMTDVIPIELLQSIGMIILILIPIIILFYYLRYHRCFSNLWTTGSPQIEKQSKRSKIVIETVETQPEDLIDIDDLKCKPPSPLLVKTLFFGLILFGFGIIIFYSIHEVLSNIVTQIYLLMIWILIFYGFYNLGIPRGGADTKALMALVIVFPFYPIIQYLTVQTSFYQMLELVPIIGYMFPFAFSVLINGAVIMLVYIILLVFYNASHHDLKLPHAFLGYKLPINEIPNKFVWLMERIENGKRKLQPFPKNSLDLRHELNLLKKHGLKKVWVTPKVPFIIPLTLGLILVVVVGNILFLIIGLFV